MFFIDYLTLFQKWIGIGNFCGKLWFNDFNHSFLVIGEAASLKMDNNEVKSNPDSEKSKPVAG
jgi:hypothetical protein